MTNEKGWKEFVQLISQLKDDQEANKLLHLLFTHEERHDVSKRILIIKGLLAEQQTQRELAQNLNVSLAKITRGSNAIKEINNPLKEKLKELLEVNNVK
jgi:TrpR family trp operon transcriptional repressor